MDVMAAHTGVVSVSNTLSGTTQDVVTLTAHAANVEIVNRSGETEIWFKVAAADPGEIEAEADGIMSCEPLSSVVLAANRPACVVRLLGDGNSYSVIALPRDGMSRAVDHNSLGARSEPGAHGASSITFSSNAGIVASNVADALDELQQAISALQG